MLDDYSKKNIIIMTRERLRKRKLKSWKKRKRHRKKEIERIK